MSDSYKKGNVTNLELIQAALAYFDRGFCVVVLHSRTIDEHGGVHCSCRDSGCKNQGKHPRFEGWPEKSARATRSQLIKSLTAFPDSNIGLLCGDWSRVVHPDARVRRWIIVLDVDAKVKEGVTGLETLSQWEDEHGKLPPTPSAKTPSGGAHYVFLHPGRTVPTRTNILPGIDIRGDQNGQIVVAPSPGYAWDQGLDTEIAAMPQGLLDVIGVTTPSGGRYRVPEVAGWPDMARRLELARKYLLRQPPAISQDGGHNTTWKSALVAIRGYALPFDVALIVMREYNERCLPPWNDRELKHKVMSAGEQGRLPWGKFLHEAGPQPVANPTTGEVEDWTSKLLVNQITGKPLSRLANVVTILQNASGWAGAICHNEHELRTILLRQTPAHEPTDTFPRQWGDVDDLRLATWIQREWGINCEPHTASSAVAQVAASTPVHPVRDWLSSLKWDGVIRLPTWLQQCLGVEDSEYARAIGVRWLIGAVARIMRPGCQVDTMLILEGPQGARKSTAVRSLVPEPRWYTNEIGDIGAKDAAMALLGKWIIELDELDSMRRVEHSRMKAFCTRRVDHYRPSYGRHTIDQPRQCVFIGTTNSDQYLGDETGNRRYWPVKCGRIDIDLLISLRDMLWAEAVARYQSGEAWWLEAEALEAMARDEQADRMGHDAWITVIAPWLESDAAHRLISSKGLIETFDILWGALELDKGRCDRSSQTRVGYCMKQLGWVKARGLTGTPRPWGYRRG